MSLTEALLAWASSCFGAPLSRPSDCSDGVGVARILHGLDEHHFSQKWLATIKVRQSCSSLFSVYMLAGFFTPGAFVFWSSMLDLRFLRMFWPFV